MKRRDLRWYDLKRANSYLRDYKPRAASSLETMVHSLEPQEPHGVEIFSPHCSRYKIEMEEDHLLESSSSHHRTDHGSSRRRS
jgi:hypothetical protein